MQKLADSGLVSKLVGVNKLPMQRENVLRALEWQC